MSTPCICCGKEATLLCDYPLGYQIAGTIPRAYIDMDSAMFTCDAPLCQACAKHVGNRFFDGVPEVTGVESIDYCPEHSAHGATVDVLPITKLDAEVLRREVFAQLRRASMRTRGG